MNHLPLIIKREYLNKVKNKSFIVMTFVSPLIMVALIFVVAYLSQLNNESSKTIAVLDETGMFIDKFESTENTKYEILTGVSLDSAKVNVERAEQYGLLYIPKVNSMDQMADQVTFYSADSPSLLLISKIEDRIGSLATDSRLAEAGMDAEKIRDLRVRVRTNLETFKGEETSKMGSVVKLAFGGIAGYLLFMFIIIYGNMIMRSVIEEKTSRIIEVIISSVKPIQLLLGKIFGTSLAGITQFAVWVVLLGVFLSVGSAMLDIDPAQAQSAQTEMVQQMQDSPEAQSEMVGLLNEINSLPLMNLVIMFILFFLGGYLMYASLYAAIGAAVDNETDTQQFMLPILMPLILAVYVGVFTVIENPHGTVSQVFSFIPLTSPVVMLMRIPFGVPIWQQILSVVILFATFIGTVWVAAKIYRVGILMYGKKASYKELFKWLKY
ncbi:ABC transporter permease [Gilvibacter sediminis]|uniref:ABC transporter permease n=1 Tax=Gilvibacter sediminis TaxID=379071 RepID=UPI0023509DBE|nr:ABC transporter permease [Gilvibacter sediminis]MDC7999312.1 ABC transporter permease [Gilvibacter sediminis]